jgi:hypothetical protein
MGKEIFPNGDTFNGRFVNGKRSGSGVYVWADGPYLHFDSNFIKNMFEKKGVLTLRNGTVIEGQFNCDENFDIAPCFIKSKSYQLTSMITPIQTVW